ncbi:serine/threonine-protein kinase [Nocardioides currus]|uniref:non-specific serine/threonine protein kinase n=1 Tax=Nocardioides currus TaxID=2133958 RepID=A0A2R7YU72_9ACTN|nr:serine/threonine-protein kinase [Nocardioides currus]PUA79927.1 serine/threonine protein kinase [Nocardioides currus]
MKCQQPGCTGSIQDGYCDVCGMAPATTAAAGPAASAAPVADGGSCAQPGCTGTIEDGYCNVCGSPAGAAAVAEQVDPVSTGTASAKTSASRIQSAALGSRRAGTTATRRAGHGSQRMRAARLGAGLTVVPAAPTVDALKAVVANPSVPEEKRTCSKCGNAIGRSSNGKPGRSEGFCPKCGQEFSFTPKLKPGDLVGGQYEVVGAIAHGGLGWIYLAKDRNVSNRWVVLKGLLNSGDPDALAAAIAEQQFLAQVEHPLIVEIYNFVTHEGAGYIVMEWVGGRSLKQILKQRMKDNNGAYDALPVDQALAYILEILPAFSYLHDLGLVYCDFKPDNLIQVGDAVKLIDLGGVRRIDDEDSAIFGTVGYQAPEVPQVGTSVASDIYTIGRTLVVLCMEFRGYQGTYLHTLPPPDTTPLFQQHDSLYQLIAKCCATDPADRFTSAEELRTQLLGVLREVVAARTTGTALTSAASLLFEAPATSASALDWSQLPALRTDPSDPQFSWLASVGDAEPAELIKALEQAPEESAEVLLRRAHASIELGDTTAARASTAQLLTQDPWEWRALWLDGLAAMKDHDWEAAKASFSAVYQQVPGELGPKLALAIACENGELPEVAEGLYATCAATDAAYAAPAAFGMARVRAAAGDTAGAVRALDLVPPTSRGYPESRQLRADVLLAGAPDDLAVLDQALSSISSVRMDPAERQRYTVRILSHALDAVTRGGSTPAAARPTVGGVSAQEAPLRDALENAYRALAREADTLDSRVALVNQANAVRNKTLV